MTNITSEYTYHNPSIDNRCDIIETTAEKHNEKYGYYDSYKTTVKGNIEFFDQTNLKTKNIAVKSFNLMQRGKKTIIASKERYRYNKINISTIVLESELKKHVINTFLKMQIPIMWRKFFKDIAENRDNIYIYIIIVISNMKNSIEIVLIGICIIYQK